VLQQLNHTAVVSTDRAPHHPRHHRLHDLSPKRDDFRSQVVHGLSQKRKILPCKFFYDQRGSQLFDRICELPEYYLTRTELQILQSHVPEMADALGTNCRVVEYGSGSSLKTSLLLDALHNPAAYVPLDISREHLLDAASRLSSNYPNLRIVPVCADYTRPFSLPETNGARRTVVYFPGSTIGNFEPHDARAFLRSAARLCGPGGGLLIGVDLKKNPTLLHAAYNDAANVTAEFNLNLLHRINHALEGNFAIDRFAHYAFYNPRLGRIEMHLLSQAAQTAHAGGTHFHFREGETIFTESSYKYTLDEFHSLARAGGWSVQKVWTDPSNLFSVQYLTVS
jgi:dimethylhistidine N-methyltransferase